MSVECHLIDSELGRNAKDVGYSDSRKLESDSLRNMSSRRTKKKGLADGTAAGISPPAIPQSGVGAHVLILCHLLGHQSIQYVEVTEPQVQFPDPFTRSGGCEDV